MFSASCILLCAAGALSYSEVFTHMKPWNPFRRANTECEMCYNGNCMTTSEAKCEYYTEASKVIHNDDDQDEKRNDTGDKLDAMLFELVDAASSSSTYKACVPFISQYTDCTKENICLGCKVCTCTEEVKWICKETQQCRPGPKINIDHRLIEIVVDILERKEKTQNTRHKRSDASVKNTSGMSNIDISKWLYREERLSPDEYDLNDNETLYRGIGEAEDTDNSITLSPIGMMGKQGLSSTLHTATHKGTKDVEVLEFNDILESWTMQSITEKASKAIYANLPYKNDGYKEITKIDDDYTEYDPIRLVKRDISNSVTQSVNQSHSQIERNFTNNNLTYTEVLNDALFGLIRITSDKERELEELLSIQENLIRIAKTHNSSIDINSMKSHDNHTKQHVTIYNVGAFENCIHKLKRDLYVAIEDIIKMEITKNSTKFSKDLKLILHAIKKHIFPEQYKKYETNVAVLPAHENQQNPRRYILPDPNNPMFNSIAYLIRILTEINKAPTDLQSTPLIPLSYNVRKIITRVIKYLYLDDFAVIDLIIQEAYYDFEKYLEDVGIKWSKMIHDIADSDVPDKLYRQKLLHITLKTDIGKIENMISLLEFARNRRMTMANGEVLEKFASRIQYNLKLIDDKVKKIISTQKTSRIKRTRDAEKRKPVKKLSMIQKLKKMFHNSKTDIKNMPRKRFPKSEIIKRLVRNKAEELQKQRTSGYRGRMERRQENLNVDSGRAKRSAWGFGAFVDRIRSIIPGYLRGKVKKHIDNKKSEKSKTRSTRIQERKKKRRTKPSTAKTTPLSG